jgi:hypothetical protein
MDKWLVLKSFYKGLTPTSIAHIDAIAGGALLGLTIAKATMLVEMVLSNQGWSEECLQPRTKGMHIIKEMDMLAAKMDLLLKRLDERVKFKEHMNNYTQAINAPFACEVCRSGGHSGNNCPKTCEEVAFTNTNNGYHPQGVKG